ncbi:MAG TPA: DUF732 domain-containing protein [Acidimicrobiales bacterium]|nr:DUF732 domain-containing protein [Acidimicrobiales bacterium]
MRAASLRHRRRLAAALVALGAVAGAGCASGVPDSAADQAFLGAVHVQAPDIGSYRSDVALVRLGHAACDAFRSGASYQELADRMVLLEGSHPLPSQDLGAVISSAADNYCPQYRSRAS